MIGNIVKILVNQFAFILFEYKLFRKAAEGGNIEIFNTILGLSSGPKGTESMIHSDEDGAFREASRTGRIKIVRKLIELTPDNRKRSQMIRVYKKSSNKCGSNSRAFESFFRIMQAL